MKVFWRWALLVAALFCLPLFVGLGDTDLGNDEAIYSFAVDKILETGDWLTPRTSPRIDIAFLEKPPLKFWIVAAPIRFGLLPHDEFGLRFWDAVMGSAAFLYVFALGVRLGGPVCGFVGVLLLFVHAPLLFDHGLRSNNMEAPLVLAYCAGIYHYLASMSAGSDRRRAAWHVAALTGSVLLGFLTKFVAVAFLPLVVLAAAVVVREDRVRLWRDRTLWMWAAVAAVAVSAPWFIYQWWQFGSDVWNIMLGAHVYKRFTAYLDPAHLQPWHYYFSALYAELRTARSLALVLPGAILLVWAAGRGRRRDEVAVILWFVLPVSLISFGSSKLYHYLYPFLPPVALAGGYVAQWLVESLTPRLEPHAARLDDRIAGVLGRAGTLLTSAAFRATLLILALASTVVAVLTLVRGGVHLRIGGTTLLRNASTLRPVLYALVFTAFGGHVRRASFAVAPLLVLWLAPVRPYMATLSQVQIEKHPLRTTRDCLQGLTAREPGAPDVGFYVDAPEGTRHHFHHYYFEPIGRWEYANPPSDAQLFVRLHVPGKQKPVLVSEPRYQSLVNRLLAHDAALLDEIARAESIPRATIDELAARPSLPMVVLPDGLLVILPGPFGRCGR